MTEKSGNPLVSVIMPCYNDAKWVAEAIEGILNQTYSPIELIVIDDGSTDNSLEIIKSYGDRLHYESGPNQNANVARNRGFALSKGDYIMFHDADDLIAEGTIKALVDILDGKDDRFIGVCPFQHLIFNPNENMLVRLDPGTSNSNPQSDEILPNWFDNPVWKPVIHSILWTRSVIKKIGTFDEELERFQDLDLLFRAGVFGAKYAWTSQGMAYYRRLSVDERIRNTKFDPFIKFQVSTNSQLRFVRKMDKMLDEAGLLEKYKVYVAQGYVAVAPAWINIDRKVGLECEKRARELAGLRAYKNSSLPHMLVDAVFSIAFREDLLNYFAKLSVGSKHRQKRLKSINGN